MSIANALAGIAKAIPTPESITANLDKIKKSSVELTGKSTTDKLNWNVNKSSNWRMKPHQRWNKKDLVKYWFDEYYRYFGTYPGRLSAYPAHYQSLEAIKFMLEKALDITEATPSYIKWYFDFIFNNNVPERIVLKKNGCTLYDIQKEKYILEFKHYVSMQPQAVIENILGEQNLFSASTSVEPVIAEKGKVDISLTDVEDAYSIHSQFFLETYGVIIAVTYLINIKGKSSQEAFAYLNKAIEKINKSKKADALNKVIEATRKYEPYPKWLPFLNVREVLPIDVKIVEESNVFSQLRSKK